ncbi:hypothetical protein [Geodermatophilus sp. SYSU D00684]
MRGQLRLMAPADGVTPDWSTIVVKGLEEAVGRHGVVWFEWAASMSTQRGAI